MRSLGSQDFSDFLGSFSMLINKIPISRLTETKRNVTIIISKIFDMR